MSSKQQTIRKIKDLLSQSISKRDYHKTDRLRYLLKQAKKLPNDIAIKSSSLSTG